MMDMNGIAFGMGSGGLLMWVFWILLAAVLLWILKGLFQGGSERPSGTPQTPLQILQERFARGEIDEAEFRMRRDLLKQTEKH